MLVPICGDLMQEDLGLSCEDQETLANEVSIVFHCAATVKFDEALRASIQMNVIGTQRLTALCRRMKQLRAFVHTSTAYANCNKEYTSEHIYEPCVNASKLVEAASSWMNEKMLDSLSAQLLDLLEQQKQFPSLPIIIIRPSIVGAIWKEPLPGWIDNVNGPTGIFIGVGKGLLTDMCGNVDIKTDIFVKIYNKIWRMMETLHYFTTREWTFESKNAVKLWNGMSVEDKKLYNFDIRKVDWDTYLFNYLMGIKIYMLKERLENLPKAQAALSWLRQFNLYSTGLCFALILRFTIWRRQKRHKWIPWRPTADLIPLEEYKRQSIPHYLEKFS
uniref:Fatty acyl-CoA reductase n=1 Tax=Meloidogyne javanica TaxID=6303 RepID=A0A915MJE3_MELJA